MTVHKAAYTASCPLSADILSECGFETIDYLIAIQCMAYIAAAVSRMSIGLPFFVLMTQTPACLSLSTPACCMTTSGCGCGDSITAGKLNSSLVMHSVIAGYRCSPELHDETSALESLHSSIRWLWLVAGI